MDLSITKSAVEALQNLERQLTFDVEAKPIFERIEQRFQELSKTVRMDGFRGGRVPVRMIKQKYGQQIQAEVLDEVVRKNFMKAIEKEKLRPAGISSLDYEPFDGVPEHVTFKVKLEVYPEFKLKGLEKVKVEKPVVDITEKDIDEMVASVRKQQATSVEVKRASKTGDKVTFSATFETEGEVLSSMPASSAVVLGETDMPKGLSDALTGVKKGDLLDVTVTFPDAFADHSLAGKKVSVKGVIDIVEESKLPKVDAEFMKNFGVDSGKEQDFREQLKASMSDRLQDAIFSRIGGQLMDGLLEHNTFEVPKALVNESIEGMKRQFLQYQGVGEDSPEYANMLASFPSESFRPEAEKQVCKRLIMEAYIEDNGIKVNDAKVDDAIDARAKSYEQPDAYKRWVKTNDEEMNGLRSYVLERASYDDMLTKAVVKEVKETFEDALSGGKVKKAKTKKETGAKKENVK